MNIQWAQEDFDHCRETWGGLQGICNSDDPLCEAGACDCLNSETVMCSFGYADVFQDGDVVAFGQVLFNVGDGE